VNVRFYGSKRLTENSGDLGVLSALDVAQHDRAAVAKVESTQRRAQFAERFVVLGLYRGTSAQLDQLKRKLTIRRRPSIE